MGKRECLPHAELAELRAAQAKAPAAADSPLKQRNRELAAAYEAARYEVQTLSMEDLVRAIVQRSAAFAYVLLRVDPERTEAGIHGPAVGSRNAYERTWQALKYDIRSFRFCSQEHGSDFWVWKGPVWRGQRWQDETRRIPAWLHLHELAGRGFAFCGTALLPNYGSLTVFNFPWGFEPHTLCYPLEAQACRVFRPPEEDDGADWWKGGGL